MMTFSDLPRDLVGEIFSRVPMTSLSTVQLTCRAWNALSKKQILGEKVARKNQFLEFMIIQSRVCSLRFDLQGILNDEYLVDPSVKQISKPNIQVEISRVFHCHGLLLCVTKDKRLLVCNPYLGQIRWIQPPTKKESFSMAKYALGYDNHKHNHKIIRIGYDDEDYESIDVYDFSSESWKVLDISPGVDVFLFNCGVSIKGNTYFESQVISIEEEITDEYLLCFDFTTERFGSPLHLPLVTCPLYWVRDEKLAVYRYECDYEIIEIWVTSKIEPNAISWNTVLKVDLGLINGLPNDFAITLFEATSFFINEEKKVVVFLDEERDETTEPSRDLLAYIFGEDGYYKSVNMGVEAQNHNESGKLVCSSYVPCLVHLKTKQLGKRKERND